MYLTVLADAWHRPIITAPGPIQQPSPVDDNVTCIYAKGSTVISFPSFASGWIWVQIANMLFKVLS